MNILQAHKYYRHRDGASKYMVELSQLLVADGHTVIPFALDEGEKTLDTPYRRYFVDSLDLSDPSNVSFFQKVQSIGRMYYSIHAEQQMRELLDTHTIDIAHIHNIYHHISPSILVALKKKGIPIVMTLHDYKLIAPNYTLFHHGKVHEENANGWYLSNIWQRSLKDSILQSAVVSGEMIFHHKIMRYYDRLIDHFISPSQFLIDVCVRHGWDRSRFTHIPNPVRVPGTFQYQDNGYVAYLGRLSEEKGVDVLVRAAKYMPHIPIRIAGEGPMKDTLDHIVKQESLSNVEFVGFLTGDALETFTQQASITVVPSIWYENNPLSILESCAAGNVVIGSDIGGISEMLPESLLVPPNDPVALAICITKWMDDKSEKRKQVGKSLRDRVREHNDPVEHVTVIEQLYEQYV